MATLAASEALSHACVGQFLFDNSGLDVYHAMCYSMETTSQNQGFKEKYQ